MLQHWRWRRLGTGLARQDNHFHDFSGGEGQCFQLHSAILCDHLLNTTVMRYYLPDGTFITTAEVAAELGATREPEPGRHSWDYAFHPQYRVDWTIEKGIEIEAEEPS